MDILILIVVMLCPLYFLWLVKQEKRNTAIAKALADIARSHVTNVGDK